jgi:hypothetical protein
LISATSRICKKEMSEEEDGGRSLGGYPKELLVVEVADANVLHETLAH